MLNGSGVQFNRGSVVSDSDEVNAFVLKKIEESLDGNLSLVRIVNGDNHRIVVVGNPRDRIMTIKSQNAAVTYSRVVLQGPSFKEVIKLHKEEGNSYLFLDGSWI